MKKLFTLCFMLLLLVGCHGSKGSNEFTIPENFDTTKKYEITFWAKNDTNMNQVNIYKNTIADFEKLYPNITVNLRLYTDYGRIYNDVITNISTNTTPNVCITYPDHIATYKTGNNVIVPLDELMVDEKYGLGGSELKFDSPTKDEMVPKFLDECFFHEHYYAIPFMRSTEACYINKDFVEKLGYSIPETLTWDFVWEVSKAATAKDENGNYLINGQKIMIPFIYKSTDNMMIQMLKQLDSPYSTSQIFNDTTKSILYDVADSAKAGAFSTFKISSYPANFLNAGQCIFAIDSTAGSTWMGSQAPLLDIAEEQIVKFETVVKEIPQYDPEHKQMISQGPSVCVFNKEDSQEVLASWLFAQYLLTNDVQIAYSQTEGYAPVTLKAQNSDVYQDYLDRCGQNNIFYYDIKIKATKLLLNNTDNTFTTPVYNGSVSLRDASGTLIENTVKGVLRKKTIDEDFMSNLWKDVNSLYRLTTVNENGSSKSDLGPLPFEAKALIATLVVIWAGLGYYYIKDLNKK